MELVDLVLACQQGTADMFDNYFEELYTALAEDTKGQIAYLAKKYFNLDRPTIESHYNLAMWEAVMGKDGMGNGKWDAERGTSFTTFLHSAADHYCSDSTRQMHAKKRKQQMSAEDISDIQSEVLDVHQLETATLKEQMECLTSALLAYADTSRKAATNAWLLSLDNSLSLTTTEKYEKMRAFLNSDVSQETCRKRCQRAKADFKKYCLEKKIEFI